MFGRRTNNSILNVDTNEDIMYCIITNNFQRVKLLVDRHNVNNVIDTKNKYTALHYAVTLPNNNITQYLLELGADPLIKQNEGYDSYELSLKSGKKYIFDFFKIKQDIKIENLESDNNKLLSKVDELKRTTEYLTNSIDAMTEKLVNNNTIIETKNKEINKLKRNLADSELAFGNLLKKQKK
jgi:ankyrin repeat protein